MSERIAGRPFDIKTDVTLECPYCRQYKTVPRTPDLPAEVRLIESICPDCDDGDRHTETWFSAPGVEVSQDRDLEGPCDCDHEADDAPSLGPCCMCERGDHVGNIMMLDRRAAIPGRGWGCLVCGLAGDGAFAVLCDICLEIYQADPSKLTVACRGYPASDGRIAIAELPPGRFEHDDERHTDGDAA